MVGTWWACLWRSNGLKNDILSAQSRQCVRRISWKLRAFDGFSVKCDARTCDIIWVLTLTTTRHSGHCTNTGNVTITSVKHPITTRIILSITCQQNYWWIKIDDKGINSEGLLVPSILRPLLRYTYRNTDSTVTCTFSIAICPTVYWCQIASSWSSFKNSWSQSTFTTAFGTKHQHNFCNNAHVTSTFIFWLSLFSS